MNLGKKISNEPIDDSIDYSILSKLMILNHMPMKNLIQASRPASDYSATTLVSKKISERKNRYLDCIPRENSKAQGKKVLNRVYQG